MHLASRRLSGNQDARIRMELQYGPYTVRQMSLAKSAASHPLQQGFSGLAAGFSSHN